MSLLAVDSIPQEIAKQLSPYLKRSIELQEIKPIVSYYCKFYMTEYIINHKLHLSSPEVANFTLLLLDDMEQCKSRLTESELAIMQDTGASYAHVEEFAFSVFHKGYLDIVNHTTTKATVGVLKSAIEFMTVLKYWGELLQPTVVKNIKYAKYHISRILKLYKAGEDPNDYMTPEDKDMENNLESELSLMHLKDPVEKSVSDPVDLPSVPTFIDDKGTDLPTVPTFIDDKDTDFPVPPTHIGDHQVLPPPPTFIDDSSEVTPDPEFKSVSPPPLLPFEPPKPAAPPLHKKITKENVKAMLSEEQRREQAQKRCKFAISALNYDDDETAIEELKEALRILQS